MQRLVYNPKAFVFIKRRNGDIADVSHYVTAGSVERRVNAVSTANFTLRNPDMFFTSKGGAHAAFFPMDPVTIYLQRLRGRPVRVFTGFLDETPYYELYPGVIEFSASCTLKKLMYTYFDPGLPYTQSFLTHYGWTPKGDGTIQNLAAQAGKEPDKDGGMGALMFATMKEIGGWKDENIKIEALPKELISRMANMLGTFSSENEAAKKELEWLIEKLVGSNDYGGSGGDSQGNPDTSKYDGEVPEIIYQVGKAMNVSTKFMVAAFETGIVESGMKNLDHGDADSKGWRQERVSIYGDGPNGATNVNAGAKRFFNECKQFDKGDGQSAGQLAADVQRPAAQYRGRYDEVRAEAVALLEKTKKKVDGKDSKDSDSGSDKDSGSNAGGASTTDHTRTTQNKRTDGRSNKSSGDNKIYAPIPGKPTISSPWGPRGGRNHNGIDVATPVGTKCVAPANGKIGNFSQTTGFGEQGGMIHFVFTSDVGQVKKGTVIGWGHVSEVYKGTGEEVQAGEVIAKSGYPKAPHVHYVQRSDSNDMDGTTDPAPLFNALQKGETTSASGGEAPIPKNSVLYVGDSLAQGTYTHLKKELGANVIIFNGVQGRNSADTLDVMENKMRESVKVVIFDAGTNDDFDDPDAYLERLQDVKGAADGAHLVLYTLNRGNVSKAKVDTMNEKVNEMKGDNVTIIDWGAQDDLLGGDGIHPTTAGYKKRGTMTANAVSPLVKPNAADSGSGSSSNDQIMSRVNATILAQTMTWASQEDILESIALQGNKSLMNDKPLLPFIQQMSEGSLRQFMSMPNGDFFAFYPDYFGETWHRPPYWIIDDIEVLEGKVRLSDTALMTHVYAIGDTTITGNDLSNRLNTTGVVSLMNAFQGELVQSDKQKDADKDDKTKNDKEEKELFHAFSRILKQDEAIQFLERYGARPDVQDFPFIRNPFFELFMAYQRFMQAWSRQFISPFKLTFMPELYPGGKVGFPEHGLQMYIEEVTHTWDYMAGFVTEAELSSPAAMLDAKGKPLSDNLPPNMPTALLEASVKEEVKK